MISIDSTKENRIMNVLRYYEIPEYLQYGAFYENLNREDEDEEIEIPSKCYKEDDNVANLEDFAQLLRVIQFWGLNNIPASVFQFCRRNEPAVWNSIAMEILDAKSPTFQALSSTERSILNAISTNMPEVINHWIVMTDKNSVEGKEATTLASGLGKLKVLKQLYESGYWWDEDTCAAAAGGGHLDCLKYARGNGCPWDVSTYEEAAKHNRLDCMLYAHSKGLPFQPGGERVCVAAARNGHLQCLKLARKYECAWNADVVCGAARQGHTAVLKYALTNDCPISAKACTLACYGGHLECLQLLHENHVPWDRHTTAAAAWCGRLRCLDYLHTNGCAWDTGTVDAAAHKGNATVLRYAMHHGCAYSDETLLYAVLSGNLKCVRYLIEEQGLYMNEDGSVFGAAFARADIACVEYLLDVGCPYTAFVFGNTRAWQAYGQAQISSGERTVDKLDTDMLSCIVLAVQRGWQWNANLVHYTCEHSLTQCHHYLSRHGALNLSITQSEHNLTRLRSVGEVMHLVDALPLKFNTASDRSVQIAAKTDVTGPGSAGWGGLALGLIGVLEVIRWR